MDVVSILGLGSIGLGFLLAFLTYRLLTPERQNNLPIYVFQFFCFLLVLVGAVLQYFADSSDHEVALVNSSIRTELSGVKQELANAYADLEAAHNVLEKIAQSIPDSVLKLQDVNKILTGNVCSGGSSGIPIWGGLGTEAAQLSTVVISRLSAAESAVNGVILDR